MATRTFPTAATGSAFTTGPRICCSTLPDAPSWNVAEQLLGKGGVVWPAGMDEEVLTTGPCLMTADTLQGMVAHLGDDYEKWTPASRRVRPNRYGYRRLGLPGRPGRAREALTARYPPVRHRRTTTAALTLRRCTKPTGAYRSPPTSMIPAQGRRTDAVAPQPPADLRLLGGRASGLAAAEHRWTHAQVGQLLGTANR